MKNLLLALVASFVTSCASLEEQATTVDAADIFRLSTPVAERVIEFGWQGDAEETALDDAVWLIDLDTSGFTERVPTGTQGDVGRALDNVTREHDRLMSEALAKDAIADYQYRIWVRSSLMLQELMEIGPYAETLEFEVSR